MDVLDGTAQHEGRFHEVPIFIGELTGRRADEGLEVPDEVGLIVIALPGDVAPV